MTWLPYVVREIGDEVKVTWLNQYCHMEMVNFVISQTSRTFLDLHETT